MTESLNKIKPSCQAHPQDLPVSPVDVIVADVVSSMINLFGLDETIQSHLLTNIRIAIPLIHTITVIDIATDFFSYSLKKHIGICIRECVWTNIFS